MEARPGQVDRETLEAARAGDGRAFERLVEAHRRELRAHCYRLSGSLHEADDLLQESLVRAWRGLPGFEGRSSLRTWLYRVATHTCLDALETRRARALPQGLSEALPPGMPPGEPRPDLPWLTACPDEVAEGTPPSPEARLGARQSVALAFLALLQTLAPRQRAVLLLRDVVGFDAAACAELLDTTVAAVNSALQRARERLGEGLPAPAPEPLPEATRALLASYVAAWESADVGRLVALLRRDATLVMPPFAGWYRGAEAIGASVAAMVFGPGAAGRFRLVETRANSLPAFACYAREEAGDELRPQSLHVLTLEADGAHGAAIAAIDAFLGPALFERFGLPAALPQ